MDNVIGIGMRILGFFMVLSLIALIIPGAAEPMLEFANADIWDSPFSFLIVVVVGGGLMLAQSGAEELVERRRREEEEAKKRK